MYANLQGGVLHGSVDEVQRGDEAIMRNRAKVSVKTDFSPAEPSANYPAKSPAGGLRP